MGQTHITAIRMLFRANGNSSQGDEEKTLKQTQKINVVDALVLFGGCLLRFDILKV